MNTARGTTHDIAARALTEHHIRTDFISRYHVLTTDQEGVCELLDHLNMDFGFFLASFMRNPGKVEATALRDYIMREAEELSICELEKHPEYQNFDVRKIVGGAILTTKRFL